jgi:hypothetical protein
VNAIANGFFGCLGATLFAIVLFVLLWAACAHELAGRGGLQ